MSNYIFNLLSKLRPNASPEVLRNLERIRIASEKHKRMVLPTPHSFPELLNKRHKVKKWEDM